MIIAVVGAGGKTTYIHEIAKEYVRQGKKVFVTTSTHMFKEADTLVTDDAEKIIAELEKNNYVMAGVGIECKIKALSKETYENVCKYADIVLVEADGSKHMPIKYPNEHEPVVYDNVDEIVVICGLHALEKPFVKVSHRLSLVKECLQVDDDTIVQPYHIQKLVMEEYVKPMKEKYPDKHIKVKAMHDDSFYQKVIAKLIESEFDVSIVKKEWFCTQPELMVFGAGHVSYELVKMASCLDFKIKVMDDRKEFVNSERFPGANELICDNFENVGKYLVEDGYYVVVTRGHKDDQCCVKAVLNHSYEYLGMIGSKRKIKTTFDNLKKEGVSEDKLRTICAPIGLDIGARTPAEIAVSILAEIIQIKNQKHSSFISRELTNVKDCGTLCIIIEKHGSTPRGEGSMMFVTEDSILDTIGGGEIEYAAIKDARLCDKVYVKEYTLNNQSAGNLGMICGGRNKVLFVPLNED